MTNKKCECCGQEIKQTIQEIKAQKLEWGAVSEKEMDWHQAVKWCDNQGEGWRLPTRVELLQAYEDKIEGFKGYYFWSSTEDYDNTAFAWAVLLDGGCTASYTKVTAYYVRCVRTL